MPRCAVIRKSLDSGQSLELYQFDPADDVSEDPSPSVSPDGKSVLFWGYIEGGDPYEWAAIVPVVGGEVKKVRMPVPASQTVRFRWGADGNSILYSRNEGAARWWRSQENHELRFRPHLRIRRVPGEPPRDLTR